MNELEHWDANEKYLVRMDERGMNPFAALDDGRYYDVIPVDCLKLDEAPEAERMPDGHIWPSNCPCVIAPTEQEAR